MSAKVLIFDIETAPMQGYIWSLWKENIPLQRLQKEWYIISWSAKWLGEDEVIYDALPNHDLYKTEPENDIEILKTLGALLDEADIVVAHYGSRFDIPKVRARFIHHELVPPSPSRVIDTAIVARRQFAFTSNKLDYLGEFLGVGRKVEHGGFELWIKCMHGDKAAWKDMIDYNIQDVILLEQVYLKLRPWIPNHPNMGLYVDVEVEVCTACGSKHISRNGHAYTSLGKFQRYLCADCGHHMRDRKRSTTKEKDKSLLTNAI